MLAFFDCSIAVINSMFFEKTYNKIFNKIYGRCQPQTPDLWVMSPARFHCATLLMYSVHRFSSKYNTKLNEYLTKIAFKEESNWFLCLSQSPPTHWFTNFVVILIFGWYYYYYVCLYLEAAVATVFEIATFPLAKVLHSRSIKNGFFSFWKFCQKRKKISKKPPKMIIFPVFCHNLSSNRLRNMILVSTNMFSGMGNRMGAISKPPDNRVAR